MARIEPFFASKLQSRPTENVRLIVHVAGDMAQADARMKELGVTTLRSFGLTKAVSILCSAETALSLLTEPWVLSIEEDRQVFTQQ